MSRIVLAFGYRRMRGKDTAGKMAAELLQLGGRKVRMDSFGRSLKEACRVIFGLTEEQTDGELRGVVDAFWGLTPRAILQRVGTELFRERFDSDIWASVVERRLLADPETDVVITDLRFPNEADMVKSVGGLVIRVDRSVPFEHPIDNHRSETSMATYEHWNHVIDNGGTLEQLRQQVDAIVKQEVGR